MSKLLYAAPVWLKTQLHKFKDLYARACLKISGSTHFPRQNLALLAMGLEPLSVHYDVIVTKFVLKALNSDDSMKSILLQIESTRSHPFYHHIVLAQKYLFEQENPVCKPASQRSNSTTSIADADKGLSHYTKDDMVVYKGKLWNELLSQDEAYAAYNNEKDTDFNMHVLLSNSKTLFSRTSSRITDTKKVMAAIHGHSCQFKSFRCSLGLEDDHFCEVCPETPDTNIHQLLDCPKYNATAMRQPLKNLADDPKHFTWAFLCEANKRQIYCYRSLAQIALHNPKIY